MVLQQPVQLKNGVTASYVEMNSVHFDATTSKATVSVSVWINEQAKMDGFEPLGKYSFMISADINQTLAQEALAYLDILVVQYLPSLVGADEAGT